MHRVLMALLVAGAASMPGVAAAQSPDVAATQAPCVAGRLPASAAPTVAPSPASSEAPCAGPAIRSPGTVRPGEIVFGTSVDPDTGVVTGSEGPFVVGTSIAFLASLDPALTTPSVRFIGTLDGVPWFDIPTLVDPAVTGPLPITTDSGTLPAPAVAFPGTVRIQIFNDSRTQLAEGTLVLVAPQ